MSLADRRTVLVRMVWIVACCVMAALAADRVVGWFVPAVPPPQVAHPSGHSETRTSIEFSYEFRTNAEGLRYHELPLAKQTASEFRVVVVGDSYVEGWGVQDEDRFTSRLERSMSTDSRPVYFVNAGTTGQGPVQFGRMLFTTGIRYHPDLALIVLYANGPFATGPTARLDVERRQDGSFFVPVQTPQWAPSGAVRRLLASAFPWTYARLRDWSSRREAQRLKTLPLLQFVEERAKREGVPASQVDAWKARVPKPLMDAAYQGRFNGGALVHGLFEPDYIANSLDLPGDRWSSFVRVLDQIVALCRDIQLPCAVVYAPAAVQYDPAAGTFERSTGIRIRPEWLTTTSELERRIEAWAATNQVPFVSLISAFRSAAAQEPGTLNFKFDTHWNARGHEVAARAIETWLRSQRLVPGQ